jgi:hypothetical protein
MSIDEILACAQRECEQAGKSRVVALRVVLDKGEAPHRELTIRPVTREALAAANICWFCADWVAVACE